MTFLLPNQQRQSTEDIPHQNYYEITTKKKKTIA